METNRCRDQEIREELQLGKIEEGVYERICEDDCYTTSDGHVLYLETHRSSVSPAGTAQQVTVLFLHGVHESADTLTAKRLACAFTMRGHVFVALEHHGHGRSSGQRGSVESFGKLVEHASEFVTDYMTTKDDSCQMVVVGHSMGGAVAAFLGAPLRQQFSSRFLGTILIAPSLSGPTPNFVTRTALSGLSR
jgi:alpha-beta hydrolase superfamily lysophospholipase